MIPGLEAAIAAGVIDRDTARRLEPYLAGNGIPAEAADPDDEKLRLVTGFNDIFVTIGLAMFLGALGYILSGLGIPGMAMGLAAAAWALAEFFTRKRRLALPSIVLLIVFVGSVFFAVLAPLAQSVWVPGLVYDSPIQTILAAIAAAVAAAVHWYRFQVPITIAAGAAAAVAILLALSGIVAPKILTDHPIVIFLPLGIAVFALAMWFDSADLKRQTRRTDIAFWLHLLAAPLIVHPLLMGITTREDASVGAAGQVIVAFLVLALVALVIDRRAMLVSSLVYLAYAAGTIITATGIETSSVAVSTLAVGAIVLTLSAAWRPLRRAVMRLVPQSLRQHLPVVA